MTVMGGVIKPGVTSGLAWKGGGEGVGVGQEGTHGSKTKLCTVFF